MNFTAEHLAILERYRPYYDGLKSNGTLTKISSVVVGEFQRIYNEEVGKRKFSIWWAACVVELIELVYINLEKYGAKQTKTPTENLPKRGRPRTKN